MTGVLCETYEDTYIRILTECTGFLARQLDPMRSRVPPPTVYESKDSKRTKVQTDFLGESSLHYHLMFIRATRSAPTMMAPTLGRACAIPKAPLTLLP